MRDSTTERLSPSMKSKSSDSAIENVRPSSRLLRPAHAAGFSCRSESSNKSL